MTLWWHVYGAELPGITEETAEDPEGFGWAMVVMGESTMDPEKVQERLPFVKDLMPGIIGGDLPYLTSFDHDPTEEERKALTPEDYWEDDEVILDGEVE